MTIKQPKGSGMCAVCVVAMATNTTTDDVYAFLNDGREEGDPIHDPEMAMYLLKHGWLMGRGWRIDDEGSEDRKSVSHADNLLMQVEGLTGERAYLAVKSRNYPGVGHAVYWDGHVVRDPDPGVPDETPISDYALLQVFPLAWLGTDYTMRLQCVPGEFPWFVKRFRDKGVAGIL